MGQTVQSESTGLPETESTGLIVDKDIIFGRLKTLHMWAFIFMGVQFIAYMAATGDTTASTNPTVSFQKDEADDDNYCDGLVCDINIRGLGKFDSLWMIPTFVALASVDHLICWLLTVYDEERARWWIFEAKSNPLRWIEYSVSASLMALALTVLCRVTDIHLWFLIFFMTAIGMGCGQILELLPQPNTPEDKAWPMAVPAKIARWLTYSLGAVAIFIPWMVLMCYFFYAASRPDSDMPDFVYGAFLGTLVMFILFGVNSLCCNVLGLYEFHKAEYIYIMLSFTAKTFLAADVFGGLKAAED